MQTDDLQYVTARALHALTGSPEWDDHAELAIKSALGPEAAESPAALVSRLDPAWVEQVLAQAAERKHADHDQQSHGNWAREAPDTGLDDPYWSGIDVSAALEEGEATADQRRPVDPDRDPDAWWDPDYEEYLIPNPFHEGFREEERDLIEDAPSGRWLKEEVPLDRLVSDQEGLRQVFDAGHAPAMDTDPATVVPFERDGEEWYFVEDGNHRLDALRRAGETTAKVRVQRGTETKHADHNQQSHGNWARDPKEVGKGFSWDPLHALEPGVPTAVDVEDLQKSFHIRRDERDPAEGGSASAVFDEVMGEWAPGHGLDLPRDGAGFVPPEERTWSLSGEQYLDAIANSLREVGQQEPLRLKWDGKKWWLEEGNHRLAAARRAGIETLLVQRGPGPPEAKHASHDQSSHGSWARGGFRTVASVDDIDVVPGRVYHASTRKIEGDRLKTPGSDEIIASLMASGYTQEQAEEEGWRGEHVFAFGTPSDEYGQYVYEIEPLGDDPWGPDDVDNGGVTLKPDAHRITRRFLVDPTEVKHDGPGPHSTGTPQAVHGSWAERLGRLIGLPEELIDAPEEDTRDRRVVEGVDAYLDDIISRILPEPEYVTFDARHLEEAVSNTDHPAHGAAVDAIYALTMAQDGEIEDLDVTHDYFDDLVDAVQDVDLERLTPAEIADLSEEDRQEYEDEMSSLLSRVEAEADAFVHTLPDYIAYEVGGSDSGSVQRWMTNNMWSIELATYDLQHASPETFLQSDAAARELKHATALELGKRISDAQGRVLRNGYGDRSHGVHGEAYAGANSAVGAWAQSSNDEHAPALFMQDTAAEHFGLQRYWDTWSHDWNDAEGAKHITDAGEEEFRESQAAILQAMYDHTQKIFEDAGITHVRLHRGQKEWSGVDRPLSSWSMDESTARNFARMYGGGLSGTEIDHDTDDVQTPPSGAVLRHKTVPVEQIVSFPGTGFGCFGESEFVILPHAPGEIPPAEGQLTLDVKHGGPGPHETTRTPQAVHGVGGRSVDWDAVMNLSPEDAKAQVMRALADSIRDWDPKEMDEWLRFQQGYFLADTDAAFQSDDPHERMAATLISSWAHSSNDADPLALNLQTAAEREFGITGAPWSRGAGERTVPEGSEEDGHLRAFLRAQYDATQALLEREGADEVRLFRGGYFEGDEDIRMRPMSSWSYDDLVAVEFASRRAGIEYFSEVPSIDADIDVMPDDFMVEVSPDVTTYPSGPTVTMEGVGGEMVDVSGIAIYAQTIPRERILSTALTGFGSMQEAEMVVLADVPAEKKHADHDQQSHGNRFTGPTVHRGIVMPDGVFPTDEVNDLLSFAMTEEEIGKDMGVGKVILDALAEGPKGLGLGRSWSHRKQVAETAQGPGVKVVLTAETREGDEDLGTHAGYNVSSEDEWTAGPGSKVRVTGVYLYDYYAARRGKNYLDEPVVMDAWRGPGVDEVKHMGPGPHPSGSPQVVHSGAGRVVDFDTLRRRLTSYADDHVFRTPKSYTMPDDYGIIDPADDTDETREAREEVRESFRRLVGKAMAGNGLNENETQMLAATTRFGPGILFGEDPSWGDAPEADIPWGQVVEFEEVVGPDDPLHWARLSTMRSHEDTPDPVTALSERTGLEPALIRRHLDAWSGGTGSYEARVMQQAAREEFGLDGAAEALPVDPEPEDLTAARTLLRGMYEHTQEHFEPGEKIVLYRGVREELAETGRPYRTRPMESWSPDPDDAEFFALGYADGEDRGEESVIMTGALMRATVPAERILSLPWTGLGNGAELAEVIVLGEQIVPDGIAGSDQFRGRGMTVYEFKHAGPGPHPGTGSPQTVHNASMGPAMKALTKMLADPDWRLFRRYNSTPSGIAIESGLEQQISDLGFTPNEIEELALAETRAYKEFFDRPDSPNVRVERVQVKVKKSDGYGGYREEWDPRVFVYPDPEGTRVARLPNRGKHYGLHAIWDDDKGEIVGWEVDDPYTYDTEFETNPVEIARTKHILDSTDKYEALHAIEKRYDLTEDARTVLDYEIPEGLSEDEEALVSTALRRIREGIWAQQRGEVPERNQTTVWGAIENGAIRLRRLRPETVADRNRAREEQDELDDLLGVTSGVVENTAENIRMLGVSGESVRRAGVPSGVEPPDDPVEEVVFTLRSAKDSDLKADVSKQVAQSWEDNGYAWEDVEQVMERVGSRFPRQTREGTASEFIANWAHTSNDEHEVSLATQDAAEREFALNGTAGWHKEAPALSADDEQVLQVTLRDMYARTQRMFEEEGITEVRVHRGQGANAGREDFSFRPMSSWSVSRVTARSFAGDSYGQSATYDVDLDKGQDLTSLVGRPGGLGASAGEPLGVVFSATVPASRVLCTPKTGFGCLNEHEIVVLGGRLEDMVKPLHGEAKHMGPGPHPSGSPQTVHAVGSRSYQSLVSHLKGLSRAKPQTRDNGIARSLLGSLHGGIPDYQHSHGTLSLSWLGDAAPLTPGADAGTTVRRAREYLRSLPTYDEEPNFAHEQAVVVLQDGSIYSNAVLVGRKRSVPTPTSMLAKQRPAAMIHNHPRENSLSSGDIRAAVHGRVGREEAVTRRGHFALTIDWDAVEDESDLTARVDWLDSLIRVIAKEQPDMSSERLRYGAGRAMAEVLTRVYPDVFSYEEVGTTQADDEIWLDSIVDDLEGRFRA